MEEPNEEPRVVPELYFLIAKFLSGGPLKVTAETLLKELERVEVLPRRLDWEGNEHTQSYEELASQYTDIPWYRLAAVCQEFLKTAQPGASPPARTLNLNLNARLSLLSDALVRPPPKYSAYKEDHSLVRRLALREVGYGRASSIGGRGGISLVSPRMLCGLRLQRRTLGHLSAVYCAVFDRTGRYVLTGADDLLVKVWSAIDGRLVCTLRGAGAEITDADVSGDGALLACGSVERLVRVWCLASGAPRAVLHAHQGTITSVRWAATCGDVRWLASTSTDGSVAFWTCAADGQFLSQPVQYVERMRPGACHMICAAWSAGGGFLAAGSADQHVRVYRLQGGAPRRVLEVAVHTDAVDSIAWAHRGLRFVSGSKDGTAALWTLHATQWRHTLLAAAHTQHAEPKEKRLKVTMVCWDCSDAYILTAVSDKTLRVWCALGGIQLRVLRGHRDEAYVLEPHPSLPGVVLSAGHDGQLLVWEVSRGELLASFHNHITGQGDGAIFDAKWGGLTSIACTDSHGHLLLLGLGAGHPLLQELPQELFFHTDYRPLVRDALGGALDEQTQTPPHLMAPPFLVDVEGAPHPPRFQRLVPGRENLALSQLIPVAEPNSRLDQMIEALAAGIRSAEARSVWRGEGVRHTAGWWQRGEPPPAPLRRALLPPPPPPVLARAQRASAELNAMEMEWYRREMRRRPLMISTQPDQPGRRRRGGRPPRPPRPSPPPRRGAQPPRMPAYQASPAHSSEASYSESAEQSPSEHSSHSSCRPRPRPRPRPRRPRARPRAPRTRQRRSSESDESSSCSYTSDKTEESSESSYSDWEAGAEMAPPARARRRPLPARRYSPSVTQKRTERPVASPGPSSVAGPSSAAGPTRAASPAPEDEAYRPSEWLCAVSPRKAPYHPQMGDHCLYFRLGHQRYFEAVAEKNVYKVNPRDKPWERTNIHECELVKVVGIKYVIKPPRVVCLRLAAIGANRNRIFTVKYHDMPDVIDFLVLKQQYDTATQRHWGHGDRFRCMIDDSWWTGVVLERMSPPAPAAPTAPSAPAAPTAPDEWACAAAHFLSLKVRWDNGEVERLSPWDLEPIDSDRLPAEPGGAVPVLPHELEAVLYRNEEEEWGDACRAIAQHISQVMSLSVAEPFVAPVDLQLYPTYALVVPYPIDLATIRARFDNLFYRRMAAAQFDVRYLATNAEQFNQPHSPIVRQARLVTDLLLHIISTWRDVDVVGKYHELTASYHSSDDEPLANHATKPPRPRPRARPPALWRRRCSEILRELTRSADAGPFTRPVSPRQAPDYGLVVTEPIDLGTVAQRLDTGYYTRASRFAEDVRRVFANSRLYNTNKRSRIYSMTVRLSALFESLYERAALPRRPRRAAPRRPHSSDEEQQANGASHSSSDSETLALRARIQHSRRKEESRPTNGASRSSSDSEALARSQHRRRKGKGIGKKSRSSAPPPAPLSDDHREEEIEVDIEQPFAETNGVTDSDDEALAHIRLTHSDTHYSHIEVLEEELDDTIEVHYTNETPQSTRKRRLVTSSGSSESEKTARTRRKRTAHKRTRESFTNPASSSSSEHSSGAGAAADARRYESDHSYKPRYSTDDDAPLLLYRKRQETTFEPPASEAGPSTSTRRAPQQNTRLRVRSPRRYNEDSEEDSVACISKRLPHHHHRQRRQMQLSSRRRQHAAQLLNVQSAGPSGGGGAQHTDHDYYNGAAARHNGGPSEAPHAVSISSRGRVRKLTAKARGLLQ